MKVIVFDPFVTPEVVREFGAEPTDFAALVESSDYITLHCPLIDNTRNLINADVLSAMKPGARLINCARGGLVDTDALVEALQSGKLAGAALDVYATEPPKNSPLLALENVVLTPHLGASTQEAQQLVSMRIAEDVCEFLKTGTAEAAVNLPRVSSDQLGLTRPYQHLAHALGRLISAIASGPISELVVRSYGKVAELDPRPITSEALVGLLDKRLGERVNRVNAAHLAQNQGISVREARSEDARDYVSLVEISVKVGDKITTVAGTLLGGRHPRLVRINDYAVEAVPSGHVLFTQHSDRPGVVGELGGILAREDINISRMQVGIADGGSMAIALVGISGPLSPSALDEISRIDAIQQVVQIEL